MTARTVHECHSLDHSNSIRDLSKVSRVANAKGFHSFQLSKRNLFIENFQSQNLVQKNNSPVRAIIFFGRGFDFENFQ